MKIHYLQHVSFEGLGSIEGWAREHRHQLTATRFYLDEPLPVLYELDWLIIMGGPMGVNDEKIHPWLTKEKRFIEQAISEGKVIVGICLGAQLIAAVLGAEVYPCTEKEIGWFPVKQSSDALQTDIGSYIPDKFDAFHWHGETFELPANAIHLARSSACEVQAFLYNQRVLGLQYHLETTRESAAELVRNCGDELVEGPFIQSADELLAKPERFLYIKTIMRDLLDRLAAIPA